MNRLPLTSGLLCLALLLAACGAPEQQSSAPATSTSAEETPAIPASIPRIALIMKSMANEFFITMAKGAETYQAAHVNEFTLLTNGIKDERDLSQQMALVEQMIAEKVNAIVIAPADSKALVPVCKRAQQAGIVVVNIDNKFDADVLKASDVKIPFVGPDNLKGARMVGDYLATKLQPGDEVAIIEGVPTAFNGQQRRLGFEEAMNAAGMKIVSTQSGQWEMAQANTIASGMLSEHPALKAILCCNDSMALGAVAAIKAAGREGQVLVVGFDNISAIQEMIRGGRVLATADQHGDQLAVYGIQFALAILDGKATPEDKETPVDLITAKELSGE